MHLTHPPPASFITACLALIAIPARAQTQTEANPYTPIYTDCPRDLTIRAASSGLSKAERSWRESRSKQIIPELRDYLELVEIPDLDVSAFVQQLNASNFPVVGLSVSGGGSQSGIGGLGIWQAFDARYAPAKEARTGGLTQIMSYITGLSGGGAITVGTIASTNFSSTDGIRKAIDFSLPYTAGPTGNTTEFFETIFENAGAKAEAGFPVSVADTFGQFWATWLPKTYSDYSDIALPGGAFALGNAPMPIVALVEVVPGQSPEIGRLMYPGNNETNGFNLTSYEVTPFEFGSWLGGRVQAFMPTEWLGTAMVNGKTQNDSQCVQGFDKFTFIQGSTTDAYTAYFIDDFYGIPVFAKRGLDGRQKSAEQSDDIPIPSDQEQSPLVQLVNETASNFDQTFNESLWATYPNPFMDYNDAMNGVSELLLVDGSLTGETNPLRPLIIPDRQLDFIIVYEASSDALNSWVNGTNLINTALSASEGNIPFPDIPDVNTMVTQNFTRQPTFFGCNATEGTPLVLYLPNSPWSSYTNFSYRKDSFTDNELDLTFENAFQLATYGNGLFDENWPVCLACAAIAGAIKRVGTDSPPQCKECFDRHCWDGKETSNEASDEDFDLKLRLNESLTYQEWNDTVWAGNGDEDKKVPQSSAGSFGGVDCLTGRAMYAAVTVLSIFLLV
ncbi:hypothetical protein AK830_g6805 [Neonectria ditissima]|uniref:Lysophospholipase n=1 Tax=Neonectria ditissima TaxID=78410 RepID=A0A0P7BHI6_9HYPO|nr:hypothetical protein AK830_g6805 [Neonectria ditissima]